MEHKGNSLFWPSYVDLMINLFFVMLVLFVLSFVLYKMENNQKEDLVIEAKKAREIKNTITQLMENEDIFKYEKAYKRYRLAVDVQFRKGEYEIGPNTMINYNSTKRNLLKAGNQLQKLMNNLWSKQQKGDSKFSNTSYLIVITGRASKDRYRLNYELSYQRALSLVRFWSQNGIRLDDEKFRELMDLQIAGVGTKGIGRFKGKEEYKNQGFIIQIVPKVGEL